MSHANKTTLFIVIFLLSLVPISYGNIFTDNFENENAFSTKKTASLTSFYDSYQSNWENLEKHKTGYFWNSLKSSTVANFTSASFKSFFPLKVVE